MSGLSVWVWRPYRPETGLLRRIERIDMKTKKKIIRQLAAYFDLKLLETHWCEDRQTTTNIAGIKSTFDNKGQVVALRQKIESNLRGITMILRED